MCLGVPAGAGSGGAPRPEPGSQRGGLGWRRRAWSLAWVVNVPSPGGLAGRGPQRRKKPRKGKNGPHGRGRPGGRGCAPARAALKTPCLRGQSSRPAENLFTSSPAVSSLFLWPPHFLFSSSCCSLPPPPAPPLPQAAAQPPPRPPSFGVLSQDPGHPGRPFFSPQIRALGGAPQEEGDAGRHRRPLGCGRQRARRVPGPQVSGGERAPWLALVEKRPGGSTGPAWGPAWLSILALPGGPCSGPSVTSPPTGLAAHQPAANPTSRPNPRITGLAGPEVAGPSPTTERHKAWDRERSLAPGREGVDGLGTFAQAWGGVGGVVPWEC